MIKNSNIGFLVFLIAACTAVEVNAELGQINIRINATIVKTACAVDTGSANKYVNLKEWNTRFFSNKNETEPVPFTLRLKDCTSNVGISFVDATPVGNEGLFSLNPESTAKNISIAILDKNMNRLNSAAISNEAPIKIDNNIQIYQFYGQYVKTATPITAGTANADVIFNITYN